MRRIVFLIMLTWLNAKIACAQQQADNARIARSAVVQNGQKARLSAYYQRLSGINEAKSIKVAEIQMEYKAGLYAVMKDKSLNETARQEKYQALKATKNRRLETILTPVEQQKVIPSNERAKSLKEIKKTN